MPVTHSQRPRPTPVGRRSRVALLILAGAVVVAGLLVRSVPGFGGDVAGGILYAVLLFLLVAVLRPGAPAVRIGVVSLGVCVAVELLQLTELPAAATALVPPTRYVLGTTFMASDLVAYAAGTVGAVLVDRFIMRSGERRAGTRRRLQ